MDVLKKDQHTQPSHQPCEQAVAPQVRVRCGIRSGDDLATCQWNVAKWQDRYYAAYEKAKQRGCI